jgi:hypothetical protein
MALVAALAMSAHAVAAESARLFAAAMDSITTSDVYQHVAVLADDVYEGRAAGSRGGRAAGQYLVKQLQEFGLVPAGAGGGYTQSFGDGCRNILALQLGYDPELQQELIVVGAHYDHVGYGNRRNSYGPFGRIHNGADDNASGVAVLLETIEALATSGLRGRRPILFAFWDGEERGLVGSRHWLANPTLPLASVSDLPYSVKFALTIDMVGRLRGGRLYVLGTRSGYGLRKLMSGPLPVSWVGPADNPSSEQRAASSEYSDAPLDPRSPPLDPRSPQLDPHLWLDFSWELHDNSDHWSFLERRVPVVLLHTGLHRDYHRPSDDVEKINRDGMRDISRYLLSVLVEIANQDRLPAFRSRVTRENEGQRQSLERTLVARSLASWPGNEPRPRLGISWRDDEAEPGSVFLTRVVAGTPAAAAGLAVHDRIYELNGQPFADAAHFQSAITSLLGAGAPQLSLLTERRGQVRTVVVKMLSVENQKTSRGVPEQNNGDSTDPLLHAGS